MIFLNSTLTSSNLRVGKLRLGLTCNNFELKWSNEMIDNMLDYCNKMEYDKLSPNDYPNSSLQFVKVFNYVNISDKKCLVLDRKSVV